MKTAALIFLLCLAGFLADRVVRLENQRYAMMVGMCQKPLVPEVPTGKTWDWKCLQDVQTRTSWAWHLLYAINDSPPPVPWSGD